MNKINKIIMTILNNNKYIKFLLNKMKSKKIRIKMKIFEYCKKMKIIIMVVLLMILILMKILDNKNNITSLFRYNNNNNNWDKT